MERFGGVGQLRKSRRRLIFVLVAESTRRNCRAGTVTVLRWRRLLCELGLGDGISTWSCPDRHPPLPANDGARNSRMASDAWLDHVGIPRDQIHPLPAERGPETAARDYATTLRGVGDFDLVLLGLGQDGHTASLFPGLDWGIGADAPDVLAVFDAPIPPLQRVSLTAARLSRARTVLFLVAGETKRHAMAQWGRGADIPARAICPDAGVDVLTEAGLLAS